MKTFILALAIFFTTKSVYAESIIVTIEQKQEKKKQSRWSLGEWMIQQRQIRLMDQWLALNTAEQIGPEWKLSYGSNQFKRNDTTEISTSDFGIELFYGFLGVGYDQLGGDGSALLKNTAIKLNLVGSSQQSTHFNILYGTSKGELSGAASSSYMGYEGDLYFINSIGYHFRYYEFTPESESDSHYFSGLYRENAIFIESGFIRILYSIYELNYKENISPAIDRGSKIKLELNF